MSHHPNLPTAELILYTVIALMLAGRRYCTRRQPPKENICSYPGHPRCSKCCRYDKKTHRYISTKFGGEDFMPPPPYWLVLGLTEEPPVGDPRHRAEGKSRVNQISEEQLDFEIITLPATSRAGSLVITPEIAPQISKFKVGRRQCRKRLQCVVPSVLRP
jgi:hypothetical protein